MDNGKKTRQTNKKRRSKNANPEKIQHSFLLILQVVDFIRGEYF